MYLSAGCNRVDLLLSVLSDSLCDEYELGAESECPAGRSFFGQSILVADRVLTAIRSMPVADRELCILDVELGVLTSVCPSFLPVVTSDEFLPEDDFFGQRIIR